jgi:hypothetical protein
LAAFGRIWSRSWENFIREVADSMRTPKGMG